MVTETVHLDDHTTEAKDALRIGVQNALSAASVVVQNNIKLRTPVDTGRLRASIVELGRTEDKVTIGTHVEYAAFVEYGTGIYHEPDPHAPWSIKSGRYKGAVVKGARSQPFMRSGLMAARLEMPTIVADEIRVALRAALPSKK